MASETKDCRKYAVRYYNLITNIGGKICRQVMVHALEKKHRKTLHDYLTDNKTKIKDKLKTNLLKQDQFENLYPGGNAASTPKNFDITLMMFLFINFIFAERNKPNSNLMKNLDNISDCDQSVIDDLARVRCYRNKLHEIPDTEVSMGENVFWQNVTKLNEIFIRLEKYYTKNGTVAKSIDIELHAKMSLGDEINNELDVLQKIRDEMQEWIKAETEIMKAIQTEITQNRFDDVKAELPEEIFVKTRQYENAKSSLKLKKIIVLHGSPGEGKTTVAKMLLREVSQERCIAISSANDIKCIGNDVDAILIDNMFGACTFVKEIFRKWQNKLNKISEWVQNGSKAKYVVITSRTHILNEAKQKLCIEGIFYDENIIQLSSNRLEQNEKLTILQNHFKKAEVSNDNESDAMHDSLLQEISELDLKDTAFTIGFPECARLFSSNKELYKKGKSFFQTPMEEMKKYISELCKRDETFVAFFVLWTFKEGESITSRDLEQPIDKTCDDILTPIKILQYSPDIFVRKIRDELKNHAHIGGLVKQDENESFSFSHYVVRDTVGMIAFERNQTAAFAFCDETFIQRYIVIPSRPDEDICHFIKLKKTRFGQLNSRMLSLVIPHCKINVKDAEGSMLSEHTSLFRSSLFENEEFCAEFFRVDSERLHILLKTPLRRCSVIFKTIVYKFIKKTDLKVGLLSFLLWQNEKATVFAKKCLEEMLRKDMETETQQELSTALYIASALGLYEVAKFCITEKGRINSEMILIAYNYTRKALSLSENKSGKESVLNLLKKAAKKDKCFPDSDGCYPIHLAAVENELDFVRETIVENPDDALIPLQMNTDILPKNKKGRAFDLKNASLYHYAVFAGNRELIMILHDNKVSASCVDSNGRSPFLYAVQIGSIKVMKSLLDIAKQNGNEMAPDANGDTPLHLAIVNSFQEKKEKKKKDFKDLALDLCKTSKNDLHHHNGNGRSPLHTACLYKDVDVIRELFKCEGFQLKEKNLIIELIEKDDVETISILLDSGFDCTLKYDDDKTPMDLAKEADKEKMFFCKNKRNNKP